MIRSLTLFCTRSSEPRLGKMSGMIAALAFLGLIGSVLVPSIASAQLDASRVSSSIVLVTGVVDNGAGRSRGSGFVVAPGIVVTNVHVVQGATQLQVIRNGQSGRDALPATLLVSSTSNDIAVLRVPGLTARAVPIAAGDAAQGAPVWAIGFPGAAEAFDAEPEFTASLTAGTVSRVFTGRAMVSTGPPTRLIQHTAAIAPGSSGGPLFDACHRVAGVNTQSASRGGATFNFSVSSTRLRAVLEEAGVTATFSTRACGVTPAADASAAPPPPNDRPTQWQPAKTPAPSTDVAAPTDPVEAPSEAQIEQDRRDQAVVARRQAQEAAARYRAADAARQRAIAAQNMAEAKRQEGIAARAREAQMELEAFGDSVTEDIQATEPDTLERIVPIALGAAALLGLGAGAFYGSAILRRAKATRDAKAAELSGKRDQMDSKSGSDVILRGTGSPIRLTHEKLSAGVIVGRSPDRADVVVPFEVVGRAHARFKRRSNRLTVQDLGSVNGTYVNGQRLEGDEEIAIKPGDRIGFGSSLTFTVETV